MHLQFLSCTGESPIQYLRLVIGGAIVPPAIKFVLKEGKSNNWFKDAGQDFVVEIPENPEYQKKKLAFEAAESERRAKEQQEREARVSLWSKALEKFRDERPLRKADGNVTFQSVKLTDDIGEVDIVATFDEEDSKIHVNNRMGVDDQLTLV